MHMFLSFIQVTIFQVSNIKSTVFHFICKNTTHSSLTVIPTIGFQVKDSLWSRKVVVNEPVSRLMYRKHNSYVRNVSFKVIMLLNLR